MFNYFWNNKFIEFENTSIDKTMTLVTLFIA